MPWYGQPENEAQKAARQKHARELDEQREAQKKAEAARDPYRKAVFSMVKGNSGGSVSRGRVRI